MNDSPERVQAERAVIESAEQWDDQSDSTARKLALHLAVRALREARKPKPRYHPIHSDHTGVGAFKFAVIDQHDHGTTVCWCFSLETTQRLAKLLNESEGSPR